MTEQQPTEIQRQTISMGWASPQTVIEYYQGCLEDFPELVADLQSLRGVLDAMLIDSSGKRILTAFACSILNLQFDRIPVLYGVDENGEYGTIVYSVETDILKVQLGLLNR